MQTLRRVDNYILDADICMNTITKAVVVRNIL